MISVLEPTYIKNQENSISCRDSGPSFPALLVPVVELFSLRRFFGILNFQQNFTSLNFQQISQWFIYMTWLLLASVILKSEEKDMKVCISLRWGWGRLPGVGEMLKRMMIGSDMSTYDRKSTSNKTSGGLILLRSLRLGQRVWSVELEIKQGYLSVFVC